MQFKALQFVFLVGIHFIVACQTQPFVRAFGNEEDTSILTGEYVFVDSDSVVTDWQYDTSDGVGGAGEPCYRKVEDGRTSVWCDSPSYLAQQCTDFQDGCCCRASCIPSVCAGERSENVPCSYVDLAESKGYCLLAEDTVPVDYACGGTCTPRSDCAAYSEDGFCEDANPSFSGTCLLYDVNDSVQMYCQKSCNMRFCDENHMCVPLRNGQNVFSGQGACIPVE